jgi:raffinose/stachyose/melibiose transport system permease protein
MIDGCSRLQVFFKVVFPLLKSTTLSLIILNVLWIWNDFLLPSLVLISANNRTLPLTTFYFHGTYSSDYGLLMASLDAHHSAGDHLLRPAAEAHHPGGYGRSY